MSEYVRKVTVDPRHALPRLPHLDLELTERCDNDCIHCCINLPAGDRVAQVREMTTDQVEDILRQAGDLGCLQVRFTGGEPLLREDFVELYLYARRLGMKVLICTNGRRISGHLTALFERVPPLAPIEVSVYGMHRESYEAVSRVSGSFGQFRRGVESLLARGVPFTVKSALLPPNRTEMDEFEKWAETIPSMRGRPGYSMFFELRARRDDQVKNELIRSCRVTPDEGLRVLARDERAYRREMAQFASRFMGEPDDRLFPCGAGRGISVDAYGRAQPCLGVRSPELTVDVPNAPLAEALEHFTSLGELRATNPEYLRRCAVCFLRGFCEQCPGRSWTEHGTLDTPVEYLCEVAHAQARFLGWLAEGEIAWKKKGFGKTTE